MKTLIGGVFLLMFSLAASAGDIGLLHLNTLHLQLEPTWTFDRVNNRIRGRGEHGETMLISQATLPPGQEDAEKLRYLAKSFSVDEMPGIASKHGNLVVRQVTPIEMPNGKIGFSAVSEKTHFFGGHSYFLQYILASPSTMVYLTIEGKGKAEPLMQRFDEIIQTQQWDD